MARATPLGALVRGLVAGVAGTAAMTVYQLAVAKLRGQPTAQRVPRRWSDAPAPAQVGRRLAEGLLGRRVTLDEVPRLTTAVHWGTGIAWGAGYGLLQGTFEAPVPVAAAGFGAGVWASSYAQLVPLGIYEPPWRYPPETLALDLSYHLVYGVGVALAYAALER